MKRILVASLVFAALAGPAYADACDSLISSAQTGIANPGSTPFSTEQLQRLLEAGRAAKQSGDIKACEAALQSPMPASNHKCEKSQNTV